MSYGAFANSTAKERYEVALCRFYSVIKKALAEKIKEKNLIDKDQASKPKTKPLIIHSVVGQSEQLCDGLHSTDFNGKCFKCGEQVFVREPK